jgi:surfeit locus 1 family protein
MSKSKTLFALVVLSAAAIFIRLAIWQFSRHLERKAKNEAITSQLALPALRIESQLDPEQIPLYRKVIAEGEYDPEQQILLKNRAYNGQAGYYVITPVLISGFDGGALVDRGWIPLDQSGQVFNSDGLIQVTGITLPSQQEPSWSLLADPTLSPDQTRLDTWRVLDIARIQEQLPYDLLPFYIKLTETENSTAEYPIPIPEFEISAGSHLGYAIQWVAFAAIALVGGFYWYRTK